MAPDLGIMTQNHKKTVYSDLGHVHKIQERIFLEKNSACGKPVGHEKLISLKNARKPCFLEWGMSAAAPLIAANCR